MFAQFTAPQHAGAPVLEILPQAKPFALAARSRSAASGQNGGASLNEELIAVANAKDRDAFATLYAYFAPRIKAFMLKRGCDMGTAEELAQMTLITVWRKAELYQPQKAAASTWIFTIARNLHIDVIRKRKRPEPDPNDPFFVPAQEKPADSQIEDQQDAERVRGAVSTLPEDQQDVLRLSFYEEKSHGEIAAHLGIPLGTVKSRLRLAFARIRKVLGDSE